MDAKQNFNINKKRHIKFKIPNPNKKGKQAILVAKTPTSSRGRCYNCGSTDHYAKECLKPLFCRYCKSSGHLISTCPILQSRREAELNVVQAPSDTFHGQGISHSILDGIIMFCDHSIRVLFDTGASHSFISKELVDSFSLNIMGLMISLRIANPVGGSATLSLLYKDVEIFLCDYSFQADLHVMRYLGFRMILEMD